MGLYSSTLDCGRKTLYILFKNQYKGRIMFAWVFGIAIVFGILDLIFTGGKTIRKDGKDLFSIIVTIMLLVMFFQWVFSK